MKKISILGTGSWGTALAQVLTDNQHDVLLYGISKSQVNDINLNHLNTEFFDSTPLNKTIKATLSLEEALNDADYLLITIPTNQVRVELTKINKLLNHKIVIINASKGFDLEKKKRISETIREVIDPKFRHEIVSLIGPSHAEEVVVRMLTTVSAVSYDLEIANQVQKLFSNDYFRVYAQDDEIGAEYGVALKNVIALAAGALAGLGYGDNTKAALITRGLAEMVRYGLKKGGEFNTYLGLTGIGDLVVTCSSKHSRNFQAGYQIGQVDSAKEFMEANKKTVEGIRTCKVIYEDIKDDDTIEMPITKAIYQVLYLGAKPSEVIQLLMLRELKIEQ